jgi:hypothetical protein
VRNILSQFLTWCAQMVCGAVVGVLGLLACMLGMYVIVYVLPRLLLALLLAPDHDAM